ncbi:MAG: DinB family protein [Chitinophagaceae bacterium]
MKELLKQYATYNTWASQQILDVILSLPEDQQLAEVPSSFNSLYNTVLHMWDAESAWWQRMKLQERLLLPSHNFTGTMKDMANGLTLQSKQWSEWISNASELAIDHVFQYQNSKKEQFKQPIYQMLLHVFNHGTYHRGQLVNMLRQLGINKIPQTDFSFWSRGRRV